MTALTKKQKAIVSENSVWVPSKEIFKRVYHKRPENRQFVEVWYKDDSGLTWHGEIMKYNKYAKEYLIYIY